MICGMEWSAFLPLKRKREAPASLAIPTRVSHPDVSVVKPFGNFGGMGNVEALAQSFVDDRCARSAAWRLGAGRNGANSHDRGEDCGGAEPAWLFQSLLGCEAGEAMARDRQVGQRISLPERASGGHRFEHHRAGPRPALRDSRP